MNIFIKNKLRIHLLGSIDFENPIISRILCILKKFQKSSINFFPWTSSHENKFQTWFEKKIMIFFPNLIWNSLYLGFYLAINWLNMIWLWISKIEVVDLLRGHLIKNINFYFFWNYQIKLKKYIKACN
jgi:hypothetical protein